MSWVWCGRRLRKRYECWWEDTETGESNKIAGSGDPHLTIGGAVAQLEAIEQLNPAADRGFRRFVAEVSVRKLTGYE